MKKQEPCLRIETARGQAEFVRSTFHRAHRQSNRAHESRTESEARVWQPKSSSRIPCAKRETRAPRLQDQEHQAERWLHPKPTSWNWPGSGPATGADTWRTRRMRPCAGRICGRKTDTMLSLQSKKQLAIRTLSPTSTGSPRPIEVKEGETRQDAIQRPRKSIVPPARSTCSSREMAKTMLARRSTASTPSIPGTPFH